jgi:hypothetical protein
MRNVFQAISYIEATIVSNMLVANGIDATVNRQGGPTRTGSVTTEVWVLHDDDGERAIELVRAFLSRQSGEYEYPGSRGIAFALQLVGGVCIVGGFALLLFALAAGERVRGIVTSFALVGFGIFLFRQGKTERSKAGPRARLTGGEVSG